MSIKRVIPEEAAKLYEQDWKLIDVRSVQEFEAGHPKGAYNVPFLHKTPQGMVANSEFITVMKTCFEKNSSLILSCRSGKRSLRAAETLIELGYTDLVDMRGGYSGEKDASGQVACKGWLDSELPIEHEADERSYESLSKQESPL